MRCTGARCTAAAPSSTRRRTDGRRPGGGGAGARAEPEPEPELAARDQASPESIRTADGGSGGAGMNRVAGNGTRGRWDPGRGEGGGKRGERGKR